MEKKVKNEMDATYVFDITIANIRTGKKTEIKQPIGAIVFWDFLTKAGVCKLFDIQEETLMPLNSTSKDEDGSSGAQTCFLDRLIGAEDLGYKMTPELFQHLYKEEKKRELWDAAKDKEARANILAKDPNNLPMKLEAIKKWQELSHLFMASESINGAYLVYPEVVDEK